MSVIHYRPIGIIHSPFNTPEGTPIQPSGARCTVAEILIFPEFSEGLANLERFSHIFLVYHFHLSKKFSLRVKPFLDTVDRGVFATRAPARPNPIGISVVRLAGMENDRLRVLDIDVVDGTPLLDIKPYVPEFDARQVDKIGWIAHKTKTIHETRDNGRFSDR